MSYLAEIKDLKLSSELIASLYKPIAQKELETIIISLPKGKSP